MFQHLVVPIDGSPASWAAVPIAARMAATVDGKMDVVTVVDRLADVVPARDDLTAGLERLGALAVEPMAQVLANDSVAAAIAKHVEETNGATVVMSSHGHGRSAAVLGSTTDELLRHIFGPIVVVGPHAGDSAGALSGVYAVPVDGSASGERIVPIAEAWAIEFGAVPWLIEVLEPSTYSSGDVFESAYTARLAHHLQHRSGREVQYEVLHHDDPAHAIVDFADQNDAALIFLSTHGRSGLDRLRLGSVAAAVVRRAHCPVVLHRPPNLDED